MSKILSGLLGVFLVVGVVGVGAYSALSDSASLTNIALSTGAADLLIKLTGVGSFDDGTNVAGAHFDELLVPGDSDSLNFELRNDSPPGISFDLTGRIPDEPTPTDDWNALSGVVECAVYLAGEDPDGDATESSGWLTLATWFGGPQGIPGDPLASGSEEQYTLECR